MYILKPTEKYLDSAKKLNKKTKKKLEEQHQLLEKDPYHPKLHSKQLRGKLTKIQSFRIGRNYRGLVLLSKKEKSIKLLRIDLRSKIYRR